MFVRYDVPVKGGATERLVCLNWCYAQPFGSMREVILQRCFAWYEETGRGLPADVQAKMAATQRFMVHCAALNTEIPK